MKFAIVGGNKIEAATGTRGICPACGSDVIAKCGEVKINHWAHKKVRGCDVWWEAETEWHRKWKDCFPTEWQEVVLPDERTGENHVADVKTGHGLVIEFQHSHIAPQERRTREQFYKNMVWVVDGTRLKRDYPRFVKGKEDFRSANDQGTFMVDFPDECFPSAWLGGSVPVIFDFSGTESINDHKDPKNYLYCLLPGQINRYAIVQRFHRESFIRSTLNGEWSWPGKDRLAQDNSASQNGNTQSRIIIRRRESPYILERGRWKRRRRL